MHRLESVDRQMSQDTRKNHTSKGYAPTGEHTRRDKLGQ
jgi:hypothetical protein